MLQRQWSWGKQRHFCMGSNVCIWRRQWHPTPVLFPGKSYGWRSLESCSPWGRWGLDTTAWLHFHFHALEKEMATHSSVLAWRILEAEEPGGLLSLKLHRVGHDWSDSAAAAAAMNVLVILQKLNEDVVRWMVVMWIIWGPHWKAIEGNMKDPWSECDTCPLKG